MSQNSYLREFCAKKSQNVFLADLTVLRLIITVWAKMLPNSYFREFCAQVSKSVFLVVLTVLRLIKLYEQKYHKTYISTSFVHKCHKLFS